MSDHCRPDPQWSDTFLFATQKNNGNRRTYCNLTLPDSAIQWDFICHKKLVFKVFTTEYFPLFQI